MEMEYPSDIQQSLFEIAKTAWEISYNISLSNYSLRVNVLSESISFLLSFRRSPHCQRGILRYHPTH